MRLSAIAADERVRFIGINALGDAVMPITGFRGSPERNPLGNTINTGMLNDLGSEGEWL